jgi:hypothetical protein
VAPASFDMRQAPFAGGYFTGDYEGLGFASSDGDAVGPASYVFVSYFSQLPGGDPSSAFSSLLAGGLRPTGMRRWPGPGAHPARRVRPTPSLGKASINAPRGRFRESTPHLRGRTGPLGQARVRGGLFSTPALDEWRPSGSPVGFRLLWRDRQRPMATAAVDS